MRKIILLIGLLLMLPVLMGVGLGPGLFEGGGDGNLALVAGPAYVLDTDGDGRAEVVYGMPDFDGDGSIVETCTAKNVPLPQCKWVGQKIYPDFTDDYNCGLHGGRGTSSCSNTIGPGGTALWVADGHTIHLDPIDYVAFPCWDVGAWKADASTPGAAPSDPAINDPRLGEEGRHDNVADGSNAACATEENNRYMITPSNRMISGNLVGSGRDQRETDQDNYTTDWGHVGTRVLVDMGQDDNTNFNSRWYDYASFIRGTGFMNGASSQYGTSPDPNGVPSNDVWGAISGAHGNGACTAPGVPDPCCSGSGSGSCWWEGVLQQHGAQGQVCVCNDSGNCSNATAGSSEDWGTIKAGDKLIYNSRIIDDAASDTAHVPIVISEDVTDTCDSGTGMVVKFGLATQPVGTSVWPGFIDQIKDVLGGQLTWLNRPLDGWWSTVYDVSSISFEPQDFYQEEGGECLQPDAGPWKFSLADVDNSAYANCDTYPLLGVYGSNVRYTDIGVKSWGHYAIDGSGQALRAVLRGVEWAHGYGSAALDPGHNWSVFDSRVYNSYINGGISASFGGNQHWENIIIEDSIFSDFMHLTQKNRAMTIKNIQVKSSTMTTLIKYGCGTESVIVDGVFVTGSWQPPSGTVSSVFWMICNDSSLPIQANSFKNIVWDGKPGRSVFRFSNVAATNPYTNALDSDTFVNNYIENVHITSDVSTAVDTAVFLFEDIDSTGSVHGDVGILMDNTIIGSGIALDVADNGHFTMECISGNCALGDFNRDPAEDYGVGSYFTGFSNYNGNGANKIEAPHFTTSVRQMAWSEEFFTGDASSYTDNSLCAKLKEDVRISEVTCYSGAGANDFNISQMSAPNDGTPTAICTADIGAAAAGETCTAASTIAVDIVTEGEWICLEAVTAGADHGGCTIEGYIR